MAIIPLHTKTFVPIDDPGEINFCFSSNERFLASSDFLSGVMAVHSLPECEPIAFFNQYAGYDAVFLSGSREIATCGINGVCGRDLSSGNIIFQHAWDESLFEFARLNFNEVDGRLALITDHWLRVWHLPSNTEIVWHKFDQMEHGLGVVFKDRQLYFMTYYSDFLSEKKWSPPKTTKIDTKESSPLTKITIRDYSDMPPPLSDDGRRAIICVDYTLGVYELWDLMECGRISQFKVQPIGSPKFILVNDMNHVVQGFGNRPDIFIWNVNTNTVDRHVSTDGSIPKFAYGHRHHLLATVLIDPLRRVNETIFTDPLNDQVLGVTIPHPVISVNNYQFSPNDRWFVSGKTTFSSSPVDSMPSGTVFLTDLDPVVALSRVASDDYRM